MADVLLACAPHLVDTPHKGRVQRAKLDFNVLNDAKLRVRKMATAAGIDFKYKKSGYPHFYFIDDKSTTGVFELSGHRVRQMLDYAVSRDLSVLKKGKSQETTIATPKGSCQWYANLRGCKYISHCRCLLPDPVSLPHGCEIYPMDIFRSTSMAKKISMQSECLGRSLSQI